MRFVSALFCSFYQNAAPVLGAPPTDITTGTSLPNDIDVVIEPLQPQPPFFFIKNFIVLNFISDFNLFGRQLLLGTFMNFLSLCGGWQYHETTPIFFYFRS
jgi:hypothetical protein